MARAQPSDDYLSTYSMFHTRDLDESRAVTSRIWSDHQVWLRSRTPFETRVNHVAVGETGLSYINCSADVGIHAPRVENAYVVYLQESGTVRHRINLQEAEGTSTTAVVYGPNQEIEIAAGPVRLLTLRFPRSQVEQGLSLRHLPLEHLEDWAREIDLRHPSGQLMQSFIRWLALEVEKSPELLSGGPLTRHMDRMLLDLFLECLKAQYPGSLPRMESIGKISLGNLEGWIEAHCHHPIGIEELATLAGVSARTIQATFRRFRGCTPHHFIQRVRLLAVRRQLMSGVPDLSITRAATQFGFFHLSHFAGSYMQMFGEHPSETLRRAKFGRHSKAD